MPKITRHGGPTGALADLLGGYSGGELAESSFDPSEHNVKDVVAYLEAHPDEAAAVKAAEAEGKNRKTIREHTPGD